MNDGKAFVERSYWIPGSWHVRMMYTDGIPFHDPSQESDRAGQHHKSHRRGAVLSTDGVSCLQTNKYYSTCWPYCHGHALPPSWLKAYNPARNGGAHDHSGFDHRVVL